MTRRGVGIAFALLATVAAGPYAVARAQPAADPLAAATQAPADPPAAATQAPLTGEAIYLRSVRAMRARPQPKYAIFHEELAVRNLSLKCSGGNLDFDLHHGDAKKAFRIWFRAKGAKDVAVDLATNERCDGASLIEPIADENRKEDIFGPRASPSPSPTPESQDGLRFPLVASVRADAARYYRVRLVDTETFEGRPVYRLALTAYREPDDHPLTGMLVDADTWLVHQLTAEISIHLVVASGWAGVTLTLGDAGPYWVARDEHIDVAANALLFHARLALDVHASDLSFPDDLPGVFPSPKPRKSPAPSPSSSPASS